MIYDSLDSSEARRTGSTLRSRALFRRIAGRSGVCAEVLKAGTAGGASCLVPLRYERRNASVGRGQDHHRASRTELRSARASISTTIPDARWRTRLTESTPGRCMCRERSTAGESAAETPISVSVVPNLQIKMGHASAMGRKLQHLTSLSRFVAEKANIIPDKRQPLWAKPPSVTKRDSTPTS